MTFDCSNLEWITHSIDLVESCDVVRSGALRICTPFSYPNGDKVDVFLHPKGGLFKEYQLSDYGQTYIYLKGAQAGMMGTSRKREIVGDITSQLNVRVSSSELFVDFQSEHLSDISDAILRLAQACMRISDLATHQRLRSANPFRDDVEDFFEAKKLAYIPDVKVLSAYGIPLRMDFEVNSDRSSSYVNVLAAMNLTSAHSAANEVFIKWHQLSQSDDSSQQRVTIYNSASRAIRCTDLRLLRENSQVISYPEEHDTLIRVLAGENAA